VRYLIKRKRNSEPKEERITIPRRIVTGKKLLKGNENKSSERYGIQCSSIGNTELVI